MSCQKDFELIHAESCDVVLLGFSIKQIVQNSSSNHDERVHISTAGASRPLGCSSRPFSGSRRACVGSFKSSTYETQRFVSMHTDHAQIGLLWRCLHRVVLIVDMF